MADQPLEIIQLDITNFKRIKAVRIEVDPGTRIVTITGRNGQGKSSVLDAIAALIDSSKNKIETPVRLGTDGAEIIGVFGNDGIPELTVTRRISSDGKMSLIVEDADGVRQQSPSTLIKSLFGHLSINPTEFADFDAKKQVEILLNLVGFDHDEWARDRKKTFDKRTVQNARALAVKAKLKGRTAPAYDLPEVVQSASALVDTIAQYESKNSTISSADSLVVQWTNRVVELELALAAARESSAEAITYRQTVGDSEPQDVIASLRDSLAQIDTKNAEIVDGRQYRELKAEESEAADAILVLESHLSDKDQLRNDALENSDLPVKGVTFTDDGLLLEGLPFKQASSAEIMRISTALAIAAHPKSGVILLQNASLMDNDSLAVVRDMATRHQMQIWEEVVNSTDSEAVTIEDGELA